MYKVFCDELSQKEKTPCYLFYYIDNMNSLKIIKLLDDIKTTLI